ncbi:hypothetical protein T4D_1373 [Trichinella pseudospiralis]|uniref:PiggyBac transposable element-derived protein domain-containing protein n=1 Tax=Trichinella pseudospiralis TaxID=6337 RepID=A0A0V1FYW6_TRIPS|nr:hypothetical protein T4D_1373 [Trichinella pseudospiralis]
MSFCGRCPCRIDMKCKPGRCGVNMWMLCDVRIWCVNIYMSKIGQKPEREQGKRLGISDPVTELLSTIFVAISDSAMPFIPIMAKMDTLPGAIRPRRKKVPKELVFCTVPGTVYAHILCSQEGTRQVILSSQHYGYCVSGEETNFKPQMIFDYNNSKGAVDAVDEMLEFAKNII